MAAKVLELSSIHREEIHVVTAKDTEEPEIKVYRVCNSDGTTMGIFANDLKLAEFKDTFDWDSVWEHTLDELDAGTLICMRKH